MKKLILAVLAIIAGQTAFTMQGPSQAPRGYFYPSAQEQATLPPLMAAMLFPGNTPVIKAQVEYLRQRSQLTIAEQLKQLAKKKYKQLGKKADPRNYLQVKPQFAAHSAREINVSGPDKVTPNRGSPMNPGYCNVKNRCR